MITVKIIKEGFGHKPGQVLTLTEFDAGRLLAFDFAETYTVPKVAPVVETQIVIQPETRHIEVSNLGAGKREFVEIEETKKPPAFFRRRGGRKPK